MSKLLNIIFSGRYKYGQRGKAEAGAVKARQVERRAKVKTPVNVPRVRGGKNGGTQRHK